MNIDSRLQIVLDRSAGNTLSDQEDPAQTASSLEWPGIFFSAQLVSWKGCNSCCLIGSRAYASARRVEFRRVGNLGIPCGDMWCTCRGTLRNNKDRSNPHQIQMVPEQAWRAFMHHHAPSSTTVTKSTEFYCISRSICSFFCLWCFDVFFFFEP